MKNIKKAGREILKIIIWFFILSLLITACMHEISPRHTVFLLVDVLMFYFGLSIFQQKNSYCFGLVALMGIICSIFFIRYLTPTAIKVWEVDTYLSFAFAISNLLLLSVAWRKYLLAKRIIAAILLLLIAIPFLISWGYYFSEHAWLGADAVMAIMQTNVNEALSYVADRTSFVMYIVLGFFVVVWTALVFTVKYVKLKSGKLPYSIAVLVFALLNIVLVFRTRDNFLTSVYAETRNYQANYDEFAREKEARRQNLVNSKLEFSDKKGVYVLVIGESENRTRMSAYGYGLDTTPWLKSMKTDPRMLLFTNAYSCHVQTVPVLTYALTAKNQYNNLSVENQASILDMAEAAGYETVWLSNQVKYGSWGTPVTVIANEANQQIWINSHTGNTLDTNYYDGEMLKHLGDIRLSDKMLIVIHLMGSHISYDGRYPKTFDKFSSEGKSSEYDNSVLYTDYFLQHLVNRLNALPNFMGMIYFSDHGEAINYGMSHDTATFIFDMTYIPFFIYFSDAYIKENPQKYQILKKDVNYTFTNDLIFNTVLGIMGIKDTAHYEPQNDLTSESYDHDINRFTTLYGKKAIKDDRE